MPSAAEYAEFEREYAEALNLKLNPELAKAKEEAEEEQKPKAEKEEKTEGEDQPEAMVSNILYFLHLGSWLMNDAITILYL